VKAYHAYGDMITYYAVNTCLTYLEKHKDTDMEHIVERMRGKRIRKWINLGGQTMPEDDVEQLRADIREGKLNTWDEIHHRYDELWENYQHEKLRHAYFSLMFLYKDETDVLTKEMWKENLDKAVRIQQYVCDQVYQSRKKDYENEIRGTTFRNDDEKIAVVGRIDDVSFVKKTHKDTEEFKQRVEDYKKRNNL
jgi:hypothetical protein